MNYLTEAEEKYTGYYNDYQKLREEVNLYLPSLAYSNLSEKKKNASWRGLIKSSNVISVKIEEELNKLRSVRFSESDSAIYGRERNKLVEKYTDLLKMVREEKTEVLRQIRKEEVLLTVPVPESAPKENCCYRCGVNIEGSFPFELKKEDQMILNIKLAEGVKFCSGGCLESYRIEHENQKRFRQEIVEKIQKKVVESKEILTKAQNRVTKLRAKVNELEEKEWRIKLLQKEGIYNPQTEKVGFWKRLGQKLGLVKSTSQSSELAVIKEQKIRLKMELEAANEELKKAILGLSVSKQKEQQYQLLEQEFHQGNKKITVNKVAEEMDE